MPASATVDLVSGAKRALRERFVGSMDDKGYVAAPEENLVPVYFGAVCVDLRRGDGDELAPALEDHAQRLKARYQVEI